MNKVQWRRVEGGLEVFVFEPNKEGVGTWKLYTHSKNFRSDDVGIRGSSRGLNTFKECVKQNYIILDVEGNPIDR